MSPIPCHSNYKKRTFCKAVKCPVQLKLNSLQEGTEEYEKVRKTCKKACKFSARDFHYWLMDNGYLIVKAEQEGV
jgi:hypothetical protein